MKIKIKMFHVEWIEYLKRENETKDFDQIKNYYIKRKLRRFIQIDRKILEDKKEFIIVHSEEEFNEKCRRNPEMKNIHLLIENKLNQNHLLWQKSSGPISKLNESLIRKEEFSLSIDEEEIFNKNSEKLLIISAEPGMGKSLILDYFTQNSSAENFFIKIILNTCKKALSDKNFKEKLKNSDDTIEFVLKSLLNKTDGQEISLLKCLAKKEKLILMFDGLDEINDYKEQIIHLIDELNKNKKIKKILITTRNHLRQELEDHFKTFAFNLNNFNEEDQKNFLYKYWRSLNLKLHERATSAKLKQSAEDLITKIKSILSKNTNDLIGIPLQTKMLADIYFVQIRNKQVSTANIKISNLAELYNEFIETKIRIQYEEKLNFQIESDRDRFEDDKEKFYENHIKLSASILFEKNKKEAIIALEFKEKDEKRIIKYGVVVAFSMNKIPTFLHQSFAEFFVAKSSFQKLIEQNKEIDNELLEIFRDQRHFLVRKFLNDFIVNHEFAREQNKNEKEDFKEGIKNCCRENLISLLKYFLEQKGVNLKTENEFLILASKVGHTAIVAYLIEKGIDVNQGGKRVKKEAEDEEKEESGSTALIEASIRGHTEIVQLLLENNDINVHQQDKKYGLTALMHASEKGHTEIVKMLLNHKDIHANKQNESLSSIALMVASLNGHTETVQMLLENVNQQDS
jgi:hypothetical protein